MNNLKTLIFTLQCDVQNELINPSKSTKFAVGFIGVFLVIFSTLSISFGAIDLFSKLGDVINDLYIGILGISTGIAVLCAAAGLIYAYLTVNQQSTARAISFVRKAIIIWLVLNLFAFFIKLGKDITSGGRIENLNNL